MARTDRTTLTCVKLAVKRRPGYPVGIPAPCYVECECGTKVDVPDHVFTNPDTLYYCPTCATEYQGMGWITSFQPFIGNPEKAPASPATRIGGA